MRIYIKTTASKQSIPFVHQHMLTGALHKWIGRNKVHDDVSLYSFSRLQGAKNVNGGLDFPDGSTFFISCWENQLTKLLVAGIQESPELFFGMKATEIVLQENPDLTEKTHFQIGSPVFIQRNLNRDKKKFYFYNDKESPNLLKETLETKMKAAGLVADETLEIRFDQNYHRKGTKKIDYKNGNHVTEIRASWCPIIIEGKPEIKQFAWNVGIGNSTGIGFGAIK
jgi:CRISPR-associated endoribonuclease Cas6